MTKLASVKPHMAVAMLLGLAACSSVGDPAQEIRIGSLQTDGGFSESELRVPPGPISARGIASVGFDLVDSSGRPVLITDAPAIIGGQNPGAPFVPLPIADEGVSSIFAPLSLSEISASVSSPCIDSGRASASFQPGLIQYTDINCAATDTITLEVSFRGRTLSATGDVTTLPPGVGSIVFTQTDQSDLELQGVPGADEARVTFVASEPPTGEDGLALPAVGRPVSFSLTGSRDGVARLEQMSAVTDGNGLVVATVLPGTVRGTVTVTATTTDPLSMSELSSASAPIQIDSRIPVQGGVSLGAMCFNVEGEDVEGNEVTLQAQIRDAEGRTARDGSEVFLLTNGGGIVGECITADGLCQVQLRTQQPRPGNGRVGVVAYLAGQESFVDANGNGRWDPGEVFGDVGETFLDVNENGRFDPDEPFVDADGDGVYSEENGEFDGYVCIDGACSFSAVNVSDSLVVVFSTSAADIELDGGAEGEARLIERGVPTALSFVIRDLNGNPIAADSSVRLTLQGAIASGLEITSPTVLLADCDSNPEPGANRYTFEINSDELVLGSSGIAVLTVESPTGTVSTLQVDLVTEAPPVVTLNASESRPVSGGSVDLTWSALGADNCIASGGWTGQRDNEGAQTVVVPVNATSSAAERIYTLTCSGPNGPVSGSAVLEVLPQIPTVTLSPNATSVVVGSTPTLTWVTTSAETCTASGDWSGIKDPSGGSQNLPALNDLGPTSYTLTCVNESGEGSATTTITAREAAGLNLTSTPVDRVQGLGSIQLQWDSPQATSCTAFGDWTGARAVTGAQTLTAPVNNTLDDLSLQYGLRCNTPDGQAESSVFLLVSPALPTVDLSASPSPVVQGGASQLSWVTTNAASCTASGDWTGSRNPAGGSETTASLVEIRPYSYTLTCDNASGSASSTAIVMVGDAPQVTLTSAPADRVDSAARINLTWQSNDVESCTAFGDWSGPRAPSGMQTLAAPANNTLNDLSLQYGLRCNSDDGPIESITFILVSPAIPTVQLTAMPGSAEQGSASQLSWVTTNAASCTASGDWTGSRNPAGGTASTGQLNEVRSYSYTLTCDNVSGSDSATAIVMVGDAPQVTITSAPADRVASGASIGLTWQSNDVVSCMAFGDWSGPRATSGIQTLTAPVNNTLDDLSLQYGLRCNTPDGQAESSVFLLVSPALPTVDLTASPNAVDQGSASQLSWVTTNAASCTASGDWTGSRNPAGGTASTGQLNEVRSYSYTLTCDNASGSDTDTAIVMVGDAPQLMLTSAPVDRVASAGQINLTWQSNDVANCTASGDWSGPRATSGSALLSAPINDGVQDVFVEYGLSCQTPSGALTSTVNLAVSPQSPSVTVTTAPVAIIASGLETASVNWSAMGASSCTASGDWAGPRDPAGGSELVGPYLVPGDRTFTLTCQNTGGSVSGAATLNVTP